MVFRSERQQRRMKRYRFRTCEVRTCNQKGASLRKTVQASVAVKGIASYGGKSACDCTLPSLGHGGRIDKSVQPALRVQHLQIVVTRVKTIYGALLVFMCHGRHLEASEWHARLRGTKRAFRRSWLG